MLRANGLLARLAGRPLALAPRRLDALLASAARDRNVEPAARGFQLTTAEDLVGHTVADGGIAVVPVVGPLVARGDWLTALFGIASYADVQAAVERAFADPSARAVLLELDTPGGEVGGLFDLVDELTALRAKTGKPLWAAASESALSAGYALASVAERIYVTQTGEVGSIGVVAVHVDQSAADAMSGLKWTLIHAGARKVDGNPHEPLSPKALADIQADVGALHAQLVERVARSRGLPADAVRATEAAIYRGTRGVEIGFADRVGTRGQAIADLRQVLDASRARAAAATPRRSVAPTQEPRSETMTTEASSAERVPVPATGETAADPAPAVGAPPAAAPTPAAPATPPAVVSPQPTPSTSAGPAETVEALRAEFAEIAAVAAQGARLGVAIDAADAMRKGIRPDALRRSVLDALAARAEASAVVAAAPTPAPAVGESPIVRRAREHAAAARS